MICRLCLVENSNVLDIFAEKGRELQMAKIIAKYFWFEPQRDDPVSKYLCYFCWTKISDFHEFYKTVEEANRKNLLLATAQGSIEIKKEDDERIFGPDKQKHNEVAAFTERPHINENGFILTNSFTSEIHENLIDIPPVVHMEIIEDHTNTLRREGFLDTAGKQELTQDSSNVVNGQKNGSFPDEYLIDEPILFSDTSELSEDERTDALDASKSEEIKRIANNLKATENTANMVTKKSKYKRNIQVKRDKNSGDTSDSNNYHGDDDVPLAKIKIKKEVFKSHRSVCTRNKNSDSKSRYRNQRAANKFNANKMIENEDAYVDNLKEENGNHEQNNHKKSNDRRSADFKEKTRKVDELIAQYVRLNCDVCGLAQTTFSKLVNHMKGEHQAEKGGYVICCNKRFHKRHRLFEHVQTHINPDSYKCNECGKTFNDKPCLRNHVLNKHQPEEAKIYECEHCSKRFIKAYILERHRLKHEERTHICEICQKGFPTASLLTAHTKMVHNNYGTMCDICAKVIRGRAAFERHQLEHQGVTLPKVQCDICFTWHKDKYGLRKHKSRHNQEGTLHICSFCGKSAPNRIALLKHQRDVHTSQRKFQCSVCEKAFKRAINLKEHMTLHTGEVLYNCPHCPRTFNSNANMHSHRKKMHPKEFEETRRLRLEMATMPQDAAAMQVGGMSISNATTIKTTTISAIKTEADYISTDAIVGTTQNTLTALQSMSLLAMVSNAAAIPTPTNTNITM